MDDIPAGKKAVRDRILQARAGLGVTERAARSAAIRLSIQNIPEYAQSRSILFYMPFREEVDISPLLDSALDDGRMCALPRCAGRRSLRLFAVTDLASDLEQGMWGIREPKDCLNECTADEISVIIVPGVAFDRQGRRIGYGAGYYDRLLAGTRALKITPAFALQVLPELEQAAHDVSVDIIVTEREIIDCRRVGE
jgi:5-formyltetrahydrofolate cyclo-ligase